jgi:hypothetical protein
MDNATSRYCSNKHSLQLEYKIEFNIWSLHSLICTSFYLS